MALSNLWCARPFGCAEILHILLRLAGFSSVMLHKKKARVQVLVPFAMEYREKLIARDI